jgi:hypothetical protein
MFVREGARGGVEVGVREGPTSHPHVTAQRGSRVVERLVNSDLGYLARCSNNRVRTGGIKFDAKLRREGTTGENLLCSHTGRC